MMWWVRDLNEVATRCWFVIFRVMYPTSIFLLLIVPLTASHPYKEHLSGVSYTRDGDINLGGLIPLHTYNITGQSCGNLRSINSLKKVEAMVYAIEKVNQNATLLPDTTIGFEIYDTCSYTAAALGESLNFVPSGKETETCCAESCRVNKRPVVGVVGAQRSSSSKQAAILFGLHHLPQISYLSTSDELGNDKTYPYFLRTVGPDSFQVKAMIDIILHYDWNYISFLNSDDTYGKSAQQQFTVLAAENDICVGITRTISLSSDVQDYDDVIEELLDLQETSHAAVVILFVQLEMAKEIFSAATRQGAKRRFIWIGSDGWGNYGEMATDGNEEVAVGSFTVVPSSEILPEFNDYFRALTSNSSDNPWLPMFIKQLTDCESCDSANLAEVDSDVSSHETLVMDSVFAFAHGLDSMCRELCPNITCGMCFNMSTFDKDALLRHLLKTSFTSLANGRVSFMPNGDSSGRYSIRYLQQSSDGSYTFIPVGMWGYGEDSNTVIPGSVPWYQEREGSPRNNETEIPRSVCSLPCNIGEKRHINPDNPCCWRCTKCQQSDIVINNGTQCHSCIDIDNKVYGWPNEDFTVCVDIEPNKNPWTAAIITISTFGILFAVVTTSLYIYNKEKPLIKASSRELSYVMFVGIFLAYVTALLFGVFRLTNGVCVMHRLGPPIATSLIYVSLAVKTIRLYRIFRASLKSVKRPKFISPNFQIALTLTITAIPIVWVMIWMIADTKPHVTKEMPYEYKRYLQITCLLSKGETIGVMVWNIFIVLVCCTFAFLTRKLPENYNETKFITFCSFCSLVVLLAFSSTYFTVGDAYYRAGYASFGMIVNATVTLLCLYVAKLYAVYFVNFDDIQVRFTTQTSTISRKFNLSPSTVNEDGQHNSGFASESSTPQDKSSGFVSSTSQGSVHETIPEEDENIKETSKASKSVSGSNPAPSSRAKKCEKPQTKVSNKVDVLPSSADVTDQKNSSRNKEETTDKSS